MTKTIDAHDARVHFGQLLNEVGEKDHTFFVKRRGKLAAVIMSPEDYMDILEIGAELSDADFNKELMESRKEIELGKVGSEEELFKMLREE
ncbi:MAG: type II toxin-antitoxin system Phd/YefM family antitoxin [Thermoleophilia bacterium]